MNIYFLLEYSKKSIVLFFIALTALSLQIFISALNPTNFYITPHLLLIVIIYLSFFQQSIFSSFAVFFFGLFYDLFSSSLLGPWAGAFILMYALVILLGNYFFFDTFFSIMGTTFICSLLSSIVFNAIHSQIGSGYRRTISDILLEALTTSLIAPSVCKVIARFYSDDNRLLSI
jgi:rod shape-determining protein MreD